MRKKLVFLIFAALVLLAMPVFAQAPGAAAGSDQSGLKVLGLALGMGIAAGLCGVGQGKATAGAAEAMARNPGNTAAIRTALIIGLALIESLTLYMFVIVVGHLAG
ncbi:MAG: ATP synthase F0 subunit C [Bryobacteraceae bacterium]